MRGDRREPLRECGPSLDAARAGRLEDGLHHGVLGVEPGELGEPPGGDAVEQFLEDLAR
ncbi:hypothetical protein [Kitasatospora paranensis]|uniref:hypothetical protein n=1 Tax=Kitasatospora paranensis TaxID=258053 RepID=UPI0031EFDFFB